LINVSLVTSCVIDEGTYTGLGYKYITEGKIYLNQEHPILAKLIIGAGEVLYEIITNKPHEWHEHLPSKLLPYRFPIFIISLLLAILIYYWTKTLAGFLPAIISLVLYYFSPQIISNSTVATLDLPFTFFFFLSIFLLWKFGKVKTIYKKNKVKIVLTLIVIASFFLLLRIVTPSPLHHFKYSGKFEEKWYSFSFDDSKWTSFNQFFERITWKENLYVRFWINKNKIENSTFLLAADDCVAEVYVNERKAYESDCKDRFDADGFFLDFKEYLDREDNLVAVRVWNKLGGVTFNLMNAKESIDYILMSFGFTLMISLLFFDLKQTLIGISIGLTMLTREGGISLLIIALIWFLYLSIKKRSWKFLSNFLLVCISSFLTLNIGYGFKTSGIYFLNFIPLPVPYLFYNPVVNSILHSQIGHLAYLFGEVSQKGWLHYYVIVLLLKTPLPLLFLFIIIIPTFNEEETIKEFLKKVKEIKPQLKSFELIIVDDSLDKTAEIARSLMKKFRIKGIVLKRIGKRGKGSAIRDGLKLAKGKYIVLIDADLQYPVEKIPVLVEKLKECDIVNTRRLRKDPFYRKLLGLGFRFWFFFFLV